MDQIAEMVKEQQELANVEKSSSKVYLDWQVVAAGKGQIKYDLQARFTRPVKKEDLTKV